MEKLSIRLKNCFGIQNFEEDFLFNKANAQLIYAPNGVMKTSLAKTFHCLQKGEIPRELIYNRQAEYSVKIDDEGIKPSEILVVKPFDSSYNPQNLSTLLVNRSQKAIYDSIYKEILDARAQIAKKLSKLSKISADKVEAQIIDDFGATDIFDAIDEIKRFEQALPELASVAYAKVLDPKVIELLQDPKIRDNIHDYSTRYNELIEQSSLFSKGKFNPSNAASVSKNLKKERFFEADHKLLMKGKAEPISDQTALDELLKKESEAILGDGELQRIANKIISGVASIKTFQEVLEESPIISTYLSNLDNLKKVLWSSYYLTDPDSFESLSLLFQSKRDRLTEIELQANLESTLWHDAQDIFKRRFFVPFGLDIEDHKNAILGTVAPNMVFTFPGEDGTAVRFDRGQLDSLDCLSVGERRAMYLLYVIFDFRARLAAGERTTIIIDDIADSFDYKNKYAIVEYLKELAEEDLFRIIILTHNFDFYRTVQGRILDKAKWDNSFIAQKCGDRIKLLKGGSKDVSSPFELWKQKFHEDPRILISMIPFIRNLIEFKDGASPDYKKLTSMIHIKHDETEPEYKTHNLKIADLEDIIAEIIPRKDLSVHFDKGMAVIDLIYETANNLIEQEDLNDSLSLERKIALSIAIRLKAEEFMWEHVADKSRISSNQTGRLYDRIVQEQAGRQDFQPIEKALSQVTLMTPENIHLNSFMYEPLIDMSMDHLVELFKNIQNLEWSGPA
jgi:hypothetical protein